MSLQLDSREREHLATSHSRRCYGFAQFHLDAVSHVLTRDAEAVALARKTVELLIALVEHRGRVLSKDELLKMLWADVVVEESNLSQNVYLLRKALGEHADRPRFIETVPKRGYRFIAEVNDCGLGDSPPDARAHTTDALDGETDGPEKATAEAEAAQDDGPASPTVTAPARRRPLVIIVAAAVVLSLLASAFFLYRRERRPPTLLEVKSVAVLPFKLLGAGSSDTPLGLGMTDTLITRLSNLKQIRVLPTSTVFKYTEGDFDPVEVGRGLGVDAVMTGTVQRDGGRIRVTVQMFAVGSGRFLWAAPFESEGDDVFKLQDAISERVAQALNFELGESGRETLTKRHTNNPDAYEAYLRGMYFLNKRTRDGLNLSIKYFQEATRKDPEYALAFAGLADALGATGRHGHAASSKEEVFEQAKAAALRALELDESLPEAHTALGMVYKNYELDPDRAEREYKRALELNPDYATARSRYGLLLLHRGKLDEAYQQMRMAYELDPLSRVYNTNMGAIHFYRREYDKAATYYQRSAEIEPDHLTVGSLGEVYEMQGRYDEAIAKFTEAVEAGKGRPAYYQLLGDLGSGYAKAGRRAEAEDILRRLNETAEEKDAEWPRIKILVGLGELDEALGLMERGARQGSPWVYHIPTIMDLRFGARYDALRADPRFAALIQSCFNSPVCK